MLPALNSLNPYGTSAFASAAAAGQAAQQPLAGFMPQGAGANLGIIPQSPALTGAGSDYSALFSQPEDLSQTASGQFITNVIDPINNKISLYNGAVDKTIAEALAWEAQNKAAKTAGNPAGITGGNAAATPAATAATAAATGGINTAAAATTAGLLQQVAQQMQAYQARGEVIPQWLVAQAQKLQVLQQQLGGGATQTTIASTANTPGGSSGGAVGATNNTTMKTLANAAETAPEIQGERGRCYEYVAKHIVDQAAATGDPVAQRMSDALKGNLAWQAINGLDPLVTEGTLKKQTFAGDEEGRHALLNSNLPPGATVVWEPKNRSAAGHIAVVDTQGRLVSDVKDPKDFALRYRQGEIAEMHVYYPAGGVNQTAVA